MQGGVSIRNKTRGPVPRFNFVSITQAVLGKKFELSLVFLTPKEARTLNKKFRHKDKACNVLSFLLSEYSGEIFLCPSVARTQAPQYQATSRDFLLYLFIHGLLHIKGYDHGVTMEKREQRLLRRFGATVVL